MSEKLQERKISEKNWPLRTKTLRAEHRRVRSEMYRDWPQMSSESSYYFLWGQTEKYTLSEYQAKTQPRLSLSVLSGAEEGPKDRQVSRLRVSQESGELL